ncbi:MAG: hypothetical protein Q8N98_04390, partial [bacterium]|nr:hypothetical protein [bacterium]
MAVETVKFGNRIDTFPGPFSPDGKLPKLGRFVNFTHSGIRQRILADGACLGDFCPGVLNGLLGKTHPELEYALEMAAKPPFNQLELYLVIKGRQVLDVVTGAYGFEEAFFAPFGCGEKQKEIDVLPFCGNGPQEAILSWLACSGIVPGGRTIETFARTSPWLKLTQIFDETGIKTTEIYHLYQAMEREPRLRRFFPEFNLHADIAFSPITIMAMRLVIFPDTAGKGNHKVYLYDPLNGLFDLVNHDIKLAYPDLCFNRKRPAG